MRLIRRGKWLGLIGVLGVILVGVTLGAMGQAGIRFPWAWLLPVIFYGTALAAAWVVRPRRVGRNHWNLPWRGTILVGLGIVVILVYALTAATVVAWGMTILVFSLFLNLDEEWAGLFKNPYPVSPIPGLGKGTVSARSTLTRWLIHIILALACGGLIAALIQIESHFADEEFFVVLQALVLAGSWLVLRGVWGCLLVRFPRIPLSDTERLEKKAGRISRLIVLCLDSRWLALTGLLIAAAFSIWTIHSYQHSFYPTEVPPYPGISAGTPFLCGDVAPVSNTYGGQETYDRLMASLAANPQNATTDYGALALGTGKQRWVEAFHQSLLAEARAGAFTGPAGSVKSVQYNAALRAYYFPQVVNTFPDLFSADEQETIRQWLAAVNRRALTVEWVDWTYALAFGKLPEGPYENQENGAGLLALLETQGLADPALSLRNRAYLDANQRGWTTSFRVTDDAAVYQAEWLNNAYFQSLWTTEVDPTNLRLSFEWLLLQALPDGAPLMYNHPGAARLDGLAYLGAMLTGDPRLLWLAGRALDYTDSHGKFASAQPGLEAAASLVGISPTQGSCLLYGDSGLPNQVGPLAPDKIVFRDGWQPDSTYLLLNLRFSGWHRYKATNTVTMLYKGGPLVVENTAGNTFAWLPVGRSLFRDKRIPRENLNGLVVSRTGMSAVLYGLTGIGGPWAQDPPYYARVVSFDPSTATSVTEISGWRGWTQRRTIALNPDGLWVWDEAQGSGDQPAAIIWHFASGATLSGNRVLLRGGDHPAEAVITIQNGEEIRAVPEESGLRVEIHGQGKVQTTIVFHFDDQVEVP